MAVSMRGGGTVDKSFELSAGAAPSLDCEATDFSASAMSPAWTRAMFDRAFQRMAVIVTDEVTEAKQAVTVDVATGNQGPLPGTAEGFASTPEEEGAMFHPTTGELWFVDHGNFQAMSRDLSSGRTVSHGKLPGDDATALAIGPKGYFPLETLQIAAVAPDGKYAVVDEQGEAFLVPVGKTSDDAPSIGGGSIVNSALPGPSASCGTALSWLDNRNLLCDNSTLGESKLTLITFSVGRDSITKTRDDLLPDTNRRNFSAVGSPDGNSFAFLSLQGHVVTLYRQSLAPGSTPVKITDVNPPAAAEDEASDQVPILLAWQ
ncbi:MAG TPA: hypothetical protein VFU43_05760 [Streptosporangiaceae bacterium]|nr:hypothetical protein [Streptosporangiaceae bacterium]